MKRGFTAWANGTILVVLLGLSSAGTVAAQVPTHYEQFVYSVVAYNGRDYSGTFVRQPVDTLYLIANADNFLSAQKTMVYFWPITGSYRLDTETIDHQFGGRLRITGNGVTRMLTMKKYTYYNVHGEYELNWKVAKGPEAAKVYARYQKIQQDNQEAEFAYHRAQSRYQQTMNNLARQISNLRRMGGDPSKLIAELRGLKQPSPPPQPSAFRLPPFKPQEAFVVNLPQGVYHIELINPDGTIMQGSEKRLVVFAGNGGRKVGYDVIPGDKWTRPESSRLPGSVLYVDGSTDLYLRPFFEKRYNDLYHRKLVNNDARGNPNMESWVKLQQVPNAQVDVHMRNTTHTETQLAFAVQQIQGSSLGYKIVLWDEVQHQPGGKPDIIAFHVPVAPSQRIIRVSVRDEKGRALSGGDRQIRIVDGSAPRFLLLILVLLPLIVAGTVMVVRSKHYSVGRSG